MTVDNFWTIPDGQAISIESATASGPSPKWTGPWLDDAYPALVVM